MSGDKGASGRWPRHSVDAILWSCTKTHEVRGCSGAFLLHLQGPSRYLAAFYLVALFLALSTLTQSVSMFQVQGQGNKAPPVEGIRNIQR